MIKRELKKKPTPKRIQSFYEGTTKPTLKIQQENTFSPTRNIISPKNFYAMSKNIEIMS